jgi:hypothetical protein
VLDHEQPGDVGQDVAPQQPMVSHGTNIAFVAAFAAIVGFLLRRRDVA